MKFAICLVLLSSAISVFSQRSEVSAEASQVRMEMVRVQRAERAAQELGHGSKGGRAAKADSLTDADVGESSSFAKNAKFMGTITAGIVVAASSCDPIDLGFPLGPDDRCLLIVDPTVTTMATYNDIGRITIPGKTVDNVFYFIGNNTTSFVLQNTGASNVSGLASYNPTITIESTALNDPAAIDPNTGLPMNGSYTTGGFGTKSISKTLSPGSFDLQTESYSRANTNGLSRTFWSAIGLPSSVIDEIYKRPMTIRLNVTVRVRNVESGTFLFSTRQLGN